MTEDTRTVADLIGALGRGEADLGAALSDRSVRFIVNEMMAQADAPIADEDEIAFLPPVNL